VTLGSEADAVFADLADDGLLAAPVATETPDTGETPEPTES
jgi:hypothetical protein